MRNSLNSSKVIGGAKCGVTFLHFPAIFRALSEYGNYGNFAPGQFSVPPPGYAASGGGNSAPPSAGNWGGPQQGGYGGGGGGNQGRMLWVCFWGLFN